MPTLRDESVLRGMTIVKNNAGAAWLPEPSTSLDPAIAEWTLYQVWQHQLKGDKADISSTGGQAIYGGTLKEGERHAREMTVLTQHKPVIQLTELDWQIAYDSA